MTKQKNGSWLKVGKGVYNTVYKCPTKHIDGITYVLKIPRYYSNLSDPQRATRKWNLINPERPAIALNGPQIILNADGAPKEIEIIPNSIYLYLERKHKNITLMAVVKNLQGEIETKDLSDLPTADAIITLINNDASYVTFKQEYQIRRALNQPYRGMLAPFIDGTNSNSQLANAETLIQIYAATRQVILDYDGRGNLIFESKTEKIICVDFDETICCNSPRKSGFFFQKDVYDAAISAYIPSTKRKLGQQVNATLLYLEKHLKSDIFPVERLNKYITTNIIFALGSFERKSIPITTKTLDILYLLTNTYPNNKLSLSAQLVHALEVNNPDFTAIEEICMELNEMKTTMTKDNYLECIKPDNFLHFIRDSIKFCPSEQGCKLA